MIAQAQTVAEKLDVRVGMSIDSRIAGAEAVGVHRPAC
jgi:hypothetical protein